MTEAKNFFFVCIYNKKEKSWMEIEVEWQTKEVKIMEKDTVFLW